MKWRRDQLFYAAMKDNVSHPGLRTSQAWILLSVGVLLILGVAGCGKSESTSPGSTTSSASPPPSTGATTVRAKPSERHFSVKLGAITGYVDSAHVAGAKIDLTGWAASSDYKHVASDVTGKVDGKAVAEAVPSIERPDVVEAYGHPALIRSGFELHVPLTSLKCSAANGGLTVFGSLNGVGSPLAYVAGTSQALGKAC
jgi:hypothetical protein